MRALLRSAWNDPRPPGAPVRVWRDWVLAAVLIPAAVLEGALRPGLPYRALSVAVTLVLIATLLWRRTRPLLMVSIAFIILAVLLDLTSDGAGRRAPVPGESADERA